MQRPREIYKERGRDIETARKNRQRERIDRARGEEM